MQLQSQQTHEIQASLEIKPANVKDNIFYLSYLLFEWNGEKENAQKCFQKIIDNVDTLKNTVSDWTFGFKLKQEGNLQEARKVFTSASNKGDIISKYGLALLQSRQDPETEKLLIAASHQLIQAKIELYQLYLEILQYEKAYDCLSALLDFFIHNFNGDFLSIPIIDEFLSKYENKLYNLNFQRDICDLAFLAQEIDKKRQLYELASTEGEPRAVVALIDNSDLVQNYQKCLEIQKQIVAGIKGDIQVTENFIKLAQNGDTNTLTAFFEYAHADPGFRLYIIKTLKDASNNGHATTRCMLGIIQSFSKDSKADGRIIIDTEKLKIKNLANEGHLIAQFQTGWLEGSFYNRIKWLGKSAKKMLLALHTLGVVFKRGNMQPEYMTKYIPPYLEEAQICFQKCTELNYAPSQFFLGQSLFSEKNNQEKSFELLEKSMVQGYANLYFFQFIKLQGSKQQTQTLLDLAKRVQSKNQFPEHIKQWALTTLKENTQNIQHPQQYCICI